MFEGCEPTIGGAAIIRGCCLGKMAFGEVVAAARARKRED
jgi:hypothetical protein